MLPSNLTLKRSSANTSSAATTLRGCAQDQIQRKRFNNWKVLFASTNKQVWVNTELNQVQINLPTHHNTEPLLAIPFNSAKVNFHAKVVQ